MDNSSKFDFNNWRHQIAHGVSDINALMALMPQDDSISPWLDRNFTTSQLPFSVTPYFVSLMSGKPDCPIFAQVISTKEELAMGEDDRRDPLGEEEREKVPHLVHRYPDRVLFLATDRCASYCRFCTRKRLVGQGPTPNLEQQIQAFDYIQNDQQIKEIIFSGGDPLLLSNRRIQDLLRRSFAIDHIDMVRFHSRMLSFAPMRIDDELCSIFGSFSPIFLVCHFNHPREITDFTRRAVTKLIESGVVVLNQSVLLKGVNDDEEVLKDLFRSLVKMRIRPYYLHQCDVVTGARHFRVPLKRSLEILQNLRGHISGLCMPTFVIDVPGGHGKVPLVNDPVVKEDDEYVYLKGFLGGVSAYPKE